MARPACSSPNASVLDGVGMSASENETRHFLPVVPHAPRLARPLSLKVGEAADQLGVDRTMRSKVLNGRASISPAMALHIECWLGCDHGGSAQVWLAQQAAYDLWPARQAVKASKALSGRKMLKFQAA